MIPSRLTFHLLAPMFGLLASVAFPAAPRHSLYLDTQGRFGYSLSVTDWLDAGLAGRVHFQGRSYYRQNYGRGEVIGGVKTDVDLGLHFPVLDFHRTWFGFMLGCRPYFALNDPGHASKNVQEWIRSDFYLAYPVTKGSLELTPSAYLVKYGYSWDDELHELAYGLLLEGRLAFRF